MNLKQGQSEPYPTVITRVEQVGEHDTPLFLVHSVPVRYRTAP